MQTKVSENLAGRVPGLSKSEHTPGPWRLDEVWMLVIGPNKEEICAIHTGQTDGTKRLNRNIAHGNGELITTAPTLLAQRDELLQALEALLQETALYANEYRPKLTGLCVQARQAIAKAKG